MSTPLAYNNGKKPTQKLCIFVVQECTIILAFLTTFCCKWPQSYVDTVALDRFVFQMYYETPENCFTPIIITNHSLLLKVCHLASVAYLSSICLAHIFVLFYL